MVEGVRCMLMRGGTSKGAFFHAADLPSDSSARNALILQLMGSPDPRQIDGLGGAHPLTTKVAVVGPTSDPRADVSYLFLQPSVEEPVVSDSQNCGNMLAAVAPFAVERGLVHVEGPSATVRVLMENTDSIAVAIIELDDGRPRYRGELAISGVPGSGAPVRLDFEDVAGSSAGSMLPTGNTTDTVAGIACTLIDYGMPVVIVAAQQLGVSGGEEPDELEAETKLRSKLEEIRIEAGYLMNLGDVTASTVPKMTLVSEPSAGGTIRTRTFIPHRCHQAIGVLGGLSVGVAAAMPGTVAHPFAALSDDGTVVLEHPTGSFGTAIDVGCADDGTVRVERAGIVRTARKLMDGIAFSREYP